MKYEQTQTWTSCKKINDNIKKKCFQTNYRYLIEISRVQMKSWAGKALETVNCYVFLERKLIGAC
jgi:hypothetical protein